MRVFKYRIKNNGTKGYVVQEFGYYVFPIFFWSTSITTGGGMGWRDAIFKTPKEALDYIYKIKREKREEKIELKKAKYIKYV